MVRFKAITGEELERTEGVSIPEWFDLKVEGAVAITDRKEVSIPEWFDLKMDLTKLKTVSAFSFNS